MSLEKIGRYKVEAELGKGAMGVVYKATDPTIGRTVALKTTRVDVHGMESDETLKRFQAEARNAGVLNHPNIITIYDAGDQEGTFYIAMEFIEGQTLQDALRERVPPVEKVIDIIKQVCAGLDFAHAKGVIHRDIKPANIMIEPNGTVKIMDFGIAKGLGSGLTSTGQVVGTPNYMSPEQVKGRKLDGRSDLFSLGVVLYEMLTGERPFTGENVTTIIYKIVNEQPPAPRDLDVTVHPGLSAAVMKALAKNPDQRYQSGAEFTRDLENYKNYGADASATVVLSTAELQAPPASAKVRAGSGTMAMATGAAAAPAPKMDSTVAVGHRAPMPHPLPAPKKPIAGIAIAVLAVVVAAGGYVGLKLKSKAAAKPQPAPAVAVAPPQQPAAAPETPKAEEKKPEAAPEPPKEEAKAEAAPVPTVGELRITSTPAGAAFTLDGLSAARYVTPFTATKLKPGSHSIVITKDGYKPESKKVEVVAGKRASVSAALLATVGFINVSSNPSGAIVAIDGKATGQLTPAKLTVEPGQHKIVVFKEGFKRQESTAEIGAGQTLPADFTLQPNAAAQSQQRQQPGQRATNVPTPNAAAANQAAQNNPQPSGPSPFRKLRRLFGGEDKGFLEVRTRPKGAEILVNGHLAPQQTPARVSVPVGKYKITVRMQGYKAITREIDVQKGQVAGLDEILEKQ